MGKDGMDGFDQRQPQVCTTSRNMIYSYYDFQPYHGQSKIVALLLHGHGDLSLGYHSTIPAFLAQDIRFIVPDLLGFGQSSKPVDSEAYRMRLMATDMCEILAHARVPENAPVEYSRSIEQMCHFGLHTLLTYMPVIHR
jgi:pimeloyl-ACP methyl ester carboxylesterase